MLFTYKIQMSCSLMLLVVFNMSGAMRIGVQIWNILLQYSVIVWITVFILQVQSRTIPCNVNNCKFSCQDVPGYSDVVEIDLSPLDSSGPKFRSIPDYQGRGYTYEWNPCTKFSDSSCSDVYACQSTGSGKYSLGSVLDVYYTTEQGQFILHYKSDKGVRQMKVILVYKEGEEGRPSAVEELVENIYTMRLYTRYAPHDGGSGDGNDDGGGGGISLGTILCIIFLVVLVLYLGIGIAFKHRQGAQGKDRIPNYEFWAKMPGLIKDGCIFSAQKTKACVSDARERRSGKSKQKDGGEYEEIENES